MTARENCQANRQVRISMSITGIGASIKPSAAGGFEISSLSSNGTARAHLHVGDRIMSIGSVATSGKSDDEVKALILGPAGSTISMVVTHTACALPPHLTALNSQVVARGTINKPVSFTRNPAPGAVPPAPAPAASARPALGLTLVPAQAGNGAKVASVTAQGLAATTGRSAPRPTQSPA